MITLIRWGLNAQSLTSSCSYLFPVGINCQASFQKLVTLISSPTVLLLFMFLLFVPSDGVLPVFTYERDIMR